MKKVLIILLIISGVFNSCGEKAKKDEMRHYPSGERIGAICNDGWRSYATGRGACSHHGGVDYWLHAD